MDETSKGFDAQGFTISLDVSDKVRNMEHKDKEIALFSDSSEIRTVIWSLNFHIECGENRKDEVKIHHK